MEWEDIKSLIVAWLIMSTATAVGMALAIFIATKIQII